VHSLHETNAEFRFNNSRHKGDGDIYCSGAMKYLTNLEKHMIVNLERFMIRSTSALYPSFSRKGIWPSSMASPTVASMKRRSNLSARRYYAGEGMKIL